MKVKQRKKPDCKGKIQPQNNIYCLYLQVITRSTIFNLEDVYYLPVGIRTVKVEGTSLLINNKPFYFKGFGKHEDADVRKNFSLFKYGHFRKVKKGKVCMEPSGPYRPEVNPVSVA